MSNTISNADDLIDVRDVIARVEALRTQRDNFDETKPVGPDSNISDDEAYELDKLEMLLESLEGNGGDEQWDGSWYPSTLIRRDYFKDYAMELAEDIGALKDNAQWPYNCIDWEKAARELRMDYTSVEFSGVSYYYR